MSNIPTFSYKDYLDKTVRLKDNGHIGADVQAEKPISAGARGLRRTKQFIKEPVHMMGEDNDPVRPGPANPNPNSVVEKNLDVPTPTVPELANKYGVSTKTIIEKLRQGIKVEAEHTTDFDTAMEIALDHLNEKLNYYELLSTVENNNHNSRSMTEGDMVITKQDFPKMISNLITVPQTGIGKKEFDPRLLSKIYQALTGDTVDYDIAKGTYVVHKKSQSK